jgi:hypothetical protein
MGGAGGCRELAGTTGSVPRNRPRWAISCARSKSGGYEWPGDGKYLHEHAEDWSLVRLGECRRPGLGRSQGEADVSGANRRRAVQTASVADPVPIRGRPHGDFRYLAAMGRSGFIISPMIHDTSDFAVLLMKGREQYFSAARPPSVVTAGNAGTRLCWESSFQVRLRQTEFPVQAEAEKFVHVQRIRIRP